MNRELLPLSPGCGLPADPPAADMRVGTTTTASMSWARSLTLWSLIVILAAATLSVVVAGFHQPFDFDESYNLPVPRNLVGGHGYATDQSLWFIPGRRVAFDPAISTGPTVLLPVALAVRLLGSAWWVYRLVPTGAYLALVGAAVLLGRRVHGPLGGVVAGLAVVAVTPGAPGWPQSQLRGSGDVLGEFTMAALLIAAAA